MVLEHKVNSHTGYSNQNCVWQYHWGTQIWQSRCEVTQLH